MCTIFGARVVSGDLNIDTILKKVQQFSTENKLVIQLFNADFIYGEDHLRTAFHHANRSMEDKAISDSLSMEILLYAASEYQIKNALAKLGIKPDTTKIAFIIIGELSDPAKIIEEFLQELCTGKLKLERTDEVLVGDRNTLTQFGIPDKELAAVPEDRWLDLILERVALLDIIK
jgi:KEOPS complex subunit Cgi121